MLRTAVRDIAIRVAQGGLAAHLEQERARWFLWTPVALGVGIAAYFAQAGEPAAWTVLALAAAALGLLAATRAGSLAHLAALALFAAALGFAAAKIRTEAVRAPVLGHEIYRADVRGIVELIEPRPKRGERLTLRVTGIRGLAPAEQPLRVRVRAMTTRAGLAAGDAVRLRATLRPPSAPTLPGGYDFARTAWYQGLGATGYALAAAEIETPAAAGRTSLVEDARAALERLRQQIGARIQAAVPGETGAIAVSLITGERGAISEETNDAYRDSGLVHILSISGLHMVIMAGAVFGAIRVLLAAFPAIALRFATKKWAAAAAILGAGFYLLLSGAAIATVRAFLMITIMFIAVMLDRQALAMRNVAIAAAIILVAMPESLLDPGFQMSFAAVVSLIAAYETARAGEGERDRSGWLRPVAFFLGGIVLSTVIASLAVAPIGAYHFHRSQQYALLANLVAIPICNLIVMPAGLIAMLVMPLGLEALPLWVMAKGIAVMTWTAHWVASLPGAVIHLPAISDASFALMIGGGLWLTIWQTRWRMLGLAAIAAGVVLAGGERKPDLIAGRNGDLVAVRTADRRLAALGPRNGGFDLTRWLENDGDSRPARDSLKGSAFRCDGVGCTTMVKGLRVAVERHPAAAADDCARADIVISSTARPAACSAPRVVIDRWAMHDEGTHALYLETGPDGGKARIARIETVAGRRGDRPWTERAATRARATSTPAPATTSRAERPEPGDDDQ
jgi:competence protein ComEC